MDATSETEPIADGYVEIDYIDPNVGHQQFKFWFKDIKHWREDDHFWILATNECIFRFNKQGCAKVFVQKNTDTYVLAKRLWDHDQHVAAWEAETAQLRKEARKQIHNQRKAFITMREAILTESAGEETELHVPESWGSEL